MNKKLILLPFSLLVISGCSPKETIIENEIHVKEKTPYDDVLIREEVDGYEELVLTNRVAGEMATATFIAYYGEKGVHINAEVIDPIVSAGNTAFFYDDNIEYVIQTKTDTNGWDVSKTIHIMVTAGGYSCVQKAATSDSWSDNYDVKLNVKVGEDFIYEVSRLTGEKQGYSVSTYVSYKLLQTTKEDGVGNITMCPAFRNTVTSQYTEFAGFTHYGCVYNSSKTHLRLTKNNCFVGGNE